MKLFPIRVKTALATNRKTLACGALLALAAACGPALAALTDFSSVPLASENSAQAKPNILFLLDNSGSMGWSHMPDAVDSSTTRVGYKNYQCNYVYYNPSIIYIPPKNPDSTDFPQSVFTAAKYNGYLSPSAAVNLLTSFQAYDNTTSAGVGTDTAQAAYYYKHTGGGALTPTLGACLNSPSATPTIPFAASDGGQWQKIIVSAISGPGASDERQNFANWYSYYRLRVYMMKGTGSRAFNQVTSDRRVGFMLLNPPGTLTATTWVPMGDFNATQRTQWFNALFATTVNSSTPLRLALSRAGRYFAHQTNNINAGITDDPMQYSCQHNFTLAVTDGFWNGSGGVKLDGTTAMDNEDGNLVVTPRPMFDGTGGTTQTTTTKVVTEAYSTSGCSGSKKKIIAATNTTTTTQSFDAAGNPTGSPTTTSSSTSSTVVSCASNPRALQSPNPKTTTTTTTVAGSGGSTGSLADVAQYYYNTDLRPAGSLGAPVGSPLQQNDVGTDNNVPVPSNPGPEDDKANWQHMTTFSMGLGLNGTLAYDPDYKTLTTGDFADLRLGAKNWPTPVADDPTALDDLWHAAVNGRGQFFSATDPDSVVSGLKKFIDGTGALTGSAAAASTSTQQPVPGDNVAFVAEYTTKAWTGELTAHEIDLGTGQVLPTVLWSAQTNLDTRTHDACDTRTIKLFRGGATDNLVNFTWNTKTCDAGGVPTGSADTGLDSSEQGNFGATQVAALSQFVSMTNGSSGTVDQKSAAAGANLVNFLRGERGNEDFVPNSTAYYRFREHVMGDIVSGQPVYVKVPFASYTDTGYAAFKSANANRTPMVYVAGNDGMLHAYFAGVVTTVSSVTTIADPKGVESWAFIPTMVLPNLYKLADNNYANQHSFFVDGTPEANDIFDTTANAWKTILVGGLNAGGKGFYALDVTDPANPKGMWEFKYSPTCFNPSSSSPQFADCQVGYSFGNPAISKLADGTWVVFVTSGYNNVVAPAAAGDGVGYLYVLEAKSGKILYKISTGAGDATTPSGLAKISAWVDDTLTDNTTQRVYGVDLLGNIWRFDVDDIIAPAGREATLLATVKDAANVAQPITVKPEITSVGSPPSPFVYIGTGRFLGTTDLPAFPPVTQQTQSIYAIRDPLSSPGPVYANLRTALKTQLITDVGTGSTGTRTVSCPSATGNCTSTDGWYADLPDNGERVNISMVLQLGTLVVASNIPENSACTVGGSSFVNFFDFATGGAVSTSLGGSVAKKIPDALIVGLSVVRLANKVFIIANPSQGAPRTIEIPISSAPPGGKRVSWREIVQ
jgi:type IV pilus assembly protein PilY1